MFSSKAFLSDTLLARLTETRVSDPDFAWRTARVRVRRERLAPSGKLNILAADHPARNVTRVGADPLAMADRRDYLAVFEASIRVSLTRKIGQTTKFEWARDSRPPDGVRHDDRSLSAALSVAW